MKKNVLIVAVLVVSVTAASAFTGGDKKSKKKKTVVTAAQIEQESDSKFAVTVLDEEGQLDLSIYAENGKEVFSEVINYKKPFKKVYDFSTQDEGNYKFDIEGDIEMEQSVFYSEMHKEDVSAEISKLKDGKIELMVRHDKVPVRIKIRNQEGRVLYSRTHTAEANFKQKFDLKKFADSDLTMTVSGKKSFMSFGL